MLLATNQHRQELLRGNLYYHLGQPLFDYINPAFDEVITNMDSWRNGSASDSSPEGYEFESRRVHIFYSAVIIFYFPSARSSFFTLVAWYLLATFLLLYTM